MTTTTKPKPASHTDVKVVGYLMGVMALLLITLSPWRAGSTAPFSHLSPAAFQGYNALLVVLLIGTFVAVYFVTKYRRGAFIAAIAVALLYMLVYALDLAGVVPVSPSPTPQASLIEVVGSVLAFFLVLASVKAVKRFGRNHQI